jgi:Zn finger protein HypA/HybF involved in hydrogenase expression
MSAQDKEAKEREQLRKNQAYLRELLECRSCSVPTERQVLLQGKCPACRGYDKRRALEDEGERG